MGKVAVAIELDEAERTELERLKRGRKVWAGLSRRASIVLLAADGLQNKEIAARLGCTQMTVSVWRKRFATERLDGLYDEPRPGAPRKIGDEAIADTIRLTLETLPEGATHWSLRSMARRTGLSGISCVGGRLNITPPWP
jgi:DNA-binding CsgD family transcriptional regulator